MCEFERMSSSPKHIHRTIGFCCLDTMHVYKNPHEVYRFTGVTASPLIETYKRLDCRSKELSNQPDN